MPKNRPASRDGHSPLFLPSNYPLNEKIKNGFVHIKSRFLTPGVNNQILAVK